MYDNLGLGKSTMNISTYYLLINSSIFSISFGEVQFCLLIHRHLHHIHNYNRSPLALSEVDYRDDRIQLAKHQSLYNVNGNEPSSTTI